MIKGKDFVIFYKQLPAKIQQMLDNFGISSFEDMLGLSAMMGIDFDKVNDYYEKKGKLVIAYGQEELADTTKEVAKALGLD